MGTIWTAGVSAAALAAVLTWGGGPARAADQPTPLTQRHDTVEAAIATPAEDLNLKKTEIPDILQRAVANPYDLSGRDTCRGIAGELVLLDQALGPDKDLPQPAEATKADPAASVLKAGVEALEPFRGVVRWISGAKAHDKKVDEAVRAGFARRGFLKGKALEMNCAPPAAPAWYRPVTLLPSPPPPAVQVVIAAPAPEPAAPPAEAVTAAAAEPAPSAPSPQPPSALREDPFAPPPFDPFAAADRAQPVS